MSTLPIGSIAAATPTSTASVTSVAQNANLASQSTFLQLLVTQLKNQDPSNPSDGTQFVTELAQFTTLSETTESATDLDTIVKALPSLGTPATGVATGITNTNNQ
jgi:flagellar basal-body rod modification protein FlgD